MKKAVFAALLAVIMIFALVLVSGDNAGKLLSSGSKAASAGREGKPREIPETATFTELMHAELGSGEDEIGYEQGNESEDIGPEDFFVEGDTVAVLDSVNKKIKFFRGGSYERSIDISYMGYPTHITRLGNNLFVVDYCVNKIYEIDVTTGEIVNKYAFPKATSRSCMLDITTDGNTVYVWDCDYGMNDLLNENAPIQRPIEISVIGNTITWATQYSYKSASFNDVSIRFIGCDDDGNAYFCVENDVPNTSIILGETTICRFSPFGDMTGVARFPDENNVFFSWSPVYLTSDGDLYCMTCTEDGVCVYRIELGRSYESKMDELIEKARRLESEYQSILLRDPSQATVTKLRDEVEATAIELASFQWKLKTGNKHLRVNTELPEYVDNTSIGQYATAMPYAYGIGDDKATFLQKRDAVCDDGYRHMTGNISEDASYEIRHTYTTGEDCSGFVSVAYGINKIGTYWFGQFYNELNSKNDLKKMDYMVRPNHHIVLFVSRNNANQTYTIYDTTKRDTGCVSQRSSPMSKYTNYQAKTPWNINCSAGNSLYYYNETKHWRYCTNCGYKIDYEPHIMVVYSGFQRCDTCGYTIYGAPIEP